ncbi:DgyrCDS4030 [Dimorphilus gyrociliatus]|uniref:DgyrCDS4030 n=1 Tax=Dimorphilus gyrociliatus TaxID=2664684 RepID=A0A7I8VF65_9ANNE|nr:DgyrCDS4030 [Dimorphilus gyrociliatus]
MPKRKIKQRYNTRKKVKKEQIPLIIDDISEFDKTYKCLAFERGLFGSKEENLARGGKINLPELVLSEIVRESLPCPYLFKLTNNERFCYCGVNEFVAPPNTIELPSWMLESLKIEETSNVKIESVELPVGTYLKIQPQDVNWLNITDCRAVLEKSLRSFSTLHKDETFPVDYNNRTYHLKVLETLPNDAIQIINCDINVDIELPVGYESAKIKDKTQERKREISNNSSTYLGRGYRIDGKIPDLYIPPTPSGMVREELKKGRPDYKHDIYELCFKLDK